MMNSTLKQRLNSKPQLQHLLLRRGFLITQQTMPSTQFPFYGNWNSVTIANYTLMCHKDSTMFHYTNQGVTHFLMGHCYNPFTMEHREDVQLKAVAESLDKGKEEYFNAISQLTGIFVVGWFDADGITFTVDPSGMQSAYYGEIDGNFMITSHPQLIADLYDLEHDPFVTRLINYKWYGRVMGAYLPSDLSAYGQVKRVVPNIEYRYCAGELSHHRFYPRVDIQECENEAQYNDVIQRAATILKNGAELVLRKWERPGISLTGGIDSNTTFAAAVGNYDRYETFSYLSAHKETIDVEAAKKIAQKFKTKHHIYSIPENNDNIEDFDLKKDILTHNSGYIAPRKENEIRKRIYLEENCHNDVEVKSWVSETIRGYWYKHLGRQSMPPLSAKLFRNLYKIFISDRSLARKIDQLFEDYITRFEYASVPKQYPPADLHYNEVTWGSWGGTNISEMKYCFDITILYNNREFLDLLFRVPLKKRIADEHHLAMKKFLNKELFDMGIRVVNMEETARRARMLNMIFTANMALPF